MLRFALSLVAPAAVVTACLDSDLSPVPNPTEQPYNGPRSACSTGPAETRAGDLPAGPSQSVQPTCVERCGSHPQLAWNGMTNRSVSIAAVPSGACSAEAEACSMVAIEPCCPGADFGRAYLFECRCTAGRWSCTSALAGGNACVCGDPHAGTDLGDAGGD